MTADDETKAVDSNASASLAASKPPSQTIHEHATLPPTSIDSDNSGPAKNSILNQFPKLSLPSLPDRSSVMASMESAAPHLKDGLLNCVVGASLGGAMGVLLFKSGKGNRAASVAAGVGVALGSTLERLSFEWQQQSKKSD
jgi:hypothetical protein